MRRPSASTVLAALALAVASIGAVPQAHRFLLRDPETHVQGTGVVVSMPVVLAAPGA